LSDVALITGAAGDIGAATARVLAEAGDQVILADLDRRAVEALAAELTASGAPATALELDVADGESVSGGLARVREQAGSLDVLVNAAGVVVLERFDRFSRDDWLRVYEVNVYGSYLCLKHAIPLLRAADRQARVVNIASGAAKRPGPLTTPYGCSKAAVISLTRSAAAALAPEIRVNCVSPGVIEGAMWEHLDSRLEQLGAPPSARYAERVRSLPLARGGSPAEVAEAIAFLASPASSYVVGHDLDVDGGQLMS
jgi:NAD(P)-dependent dehydrogenase (short-subunit alcohol dehydrogenase family)